MPTDQRRNVHQWIEVQADLFNPVNPAVQAIQTLARLSSLPQPLDSFIRPWYASLGTPPWDHPETPHPSSLQPSPTALVLILTLSLGKLILLPLALTSSL